MSTENSTKDKRGNLVKEGDIVRLLKVESSLIQNLHVDERENVRSMIGKEYEVEEIDEYGNAWFVQWWSHGESKSESHSLALAPEEMELVSRSNGR